MCDTVVNYYLVSDVKEEDEEIHNVNYNHTSLEGLPISFE